MASDLTRAPPPKPWERSASSPSSDLPISSSVARAAQLQEPMTTTTTTGLVPDRLSPSSTSSLNPHLGTAPHVPPRPTALSSSYGSGYGGYGRYGSSYGSSYGGYGSSYGGYGNSYGNSYGYGGYGSGYGGSYGSGYGGYGSGYGYNSTLSRYGGYGGYGRPYEGQIPQGGVFEGGIQRFGLMVDSFSRFSRLLDANFDALHGSFASVLRLVDVFGEFMYVIRTFALFKFIFGTLSRCRRVFRWLLGRHTLQGGGGETIELADYKKFQSDQKRQRTIPMLLIILGLTCVSAPLLLSRMAKFLKRIDRTKLERVWNEDEGENPQQEIKAVALYQFPGETNMDLRFNKGDIIKILNKPFPDWWEGELNGMRGIFPAHFVQIIEGNGMQHHPTQNT